MTPRFCAHCGQPMHPPTARFCPNTGAALTTAQPAAPAAQAQAAPAAAPALATVTAGTAQPNQPTATATGAAPQDAFFKGLHTLSRAWTLCKPHFYTLARSAAFGLIPIYVSNQLLLYWSFGSFRFGRRGYFFDYGWTGMSIGHQLIASMLLTGIGLPLVVASITIFVAQLHTGRVPTLAQVWRTLAGRAVPLAITGFIGGLAIALGYIVLLIPGLILSYLFCMSSIVAALENQSGPAALARSAWLTRRNWH